MQTLCPNCQVLFPTTQVEYDELLFARYHTQAVGRWGARARSYRAISTFGHATLCEPCAARFNRVVWLRITGRRLSNYGFGALILGALLFVIVSAQAPTWGRVPLAFVLALPLVAGLCVLLAGAVMYGGSRIMRASAARFLLPGGVRPQSGERAEGSGHA